MGHYFLDTKYGYNKFCNMATVFELLNNNYHKIPQGQNYHIKINKMIINNISFTYNILCKGSRTYASSKVRLILINYKITLVSVDRQTQIYYYTIIMCIENALI